MRTFGLTILILGSLWIVQDCFVGFTGYQRMRWMHTSQNLPPGEMIEREDAIMASRQLALDLKTRHRLILLPAGLMLAGGAMLAMLKPNSMKEQTGNFQIKDDTALSPVDAPRSVPFHPLSSQASLFKRAGNFVVDAFFIIGFSILCDVVRSEPGGGGEFLLPITFAYFWLMEAAFGRTIGKVISHTRVVNRHGRKITWTEALVRTICRFVPFEPLSFLGRTQRGWHDSLSNTWVVTSSSTAPEGAPSNE